MISSASMGSKIVPMRVSPCTLKQRSSFAHLPRCYSPSHISLAETKVLPLGGGGAMPGRNLIGLSTSHLGGDYVKCASNLHWLPSRHKVRPLVTRASKSFSLPRMEARPRWWWRSIACIPYLLPISDALVYAENVFQLKTFVELVGFLAYPLMDTFILLPSWAMLMISYVSYLWVIRRKEWPHFLRFHVVMAMLLSSAVQVSGIMSTWLPPSLYHGEIQGYFWAAFVFAQLFTLLECIRCALCGAYADIPIATDAACIHTTLR